MIEFIIPLVVLLFVSLSVIVLLLMIHKGIVDTEDESQND